MRLRTHVFVLAGVVSTVIIWLRVGVVFRSYSSLEVTFFSARFTFFSSLARSKKVSLGFD